MGKIYKSMQGKEVDMEKLMTQNELMPAVGNVSVNARGDELGQGGKIIKKREEIVAEYYENNPNAVSRQNQPVKTKDPTLTTFETGVASKRTK
jgi:hypothetical protein